MFDEHKEIYLFFTVLSPDSTLQATWIQNVSQVACRVTNSFVEYHRFDTLMSHVSDIRMREKNEFCLHKVIYVVYYSLLYVLRMASLMLSTVGIIAFSRFCA